MSKPFSFLIVLVTILPAFAAFYVALQKLGFVLSKMNDAKINNWNCVPRVWNDSANTYVLFTTDIGNAAAVDVYNGMISYMAGATGNATSTYSGNGASYIMVYKGDYDPNLLPPAPLQALADVISKYENPILGNYTCKQQVFQSKSGWAYVGIKVPLGVNDNYQNAYVDKAIWINKLVEKSVPFRMLLMVTTVFWNCKLINRFNVNCLRVY